MQVEGVSVVNARAAFSVEFYLLNCAKWTLIVLDYKRGKESKSFYSLIRM